MTVACFLGVDPDTKNTALAVLSAGALNFQGFSKPVVAWTDVASVDATQDVETRIRRMIQRLDDAIGNLYYDLSPGMVGYKITHAIVEGQEKYPHDNVRPNDLIHLAQVAGMAAAFIQAHHDITATIVRPRDWKGSVPKNIHQKRILSKIIIGTECDYMDCNKTQQGHVIDAIGLAYYGFEQHKLGALKNGP